MLSSELHSDGSREGKLFAPGYGEFYTSGGGDVEALALAVPTDAATGPVPPELTTLSQGALSIIDAAAAGRWRAASNTVADMVVAWERQKAAEVPRLLEPLMDRAVEALARAVDARATARAQRTAIEAARLSGDLQLRYRSVTEIDLARMDLWAAQLIIDEAAGDTAGVGADAYALDYVRDRDPERVDPSPSYASTWSWARSRSRSRTRSRRRQPRRPGDCARRSPRSPLRSRGFGDLPIDGCAHRHPTARDGTPISSAEPGPGKIVATS